MWGFGLWDLRGYRSLRVLFSWLALYRGPDDRVTAEAMLAWSTQNRHAARWFHSSYSKMLAAFISSPHLKRLLTTISEYVTDQPERLTVGEMAPLFSYYFEGGFYPTVGSQKLANLLRSIVEENGGEVRLCTCVTKVAGVVTTTGACHHAHLIISNGDVTTTLCDLIGKFPLPSRYAQRIARSSAWALGNPGRATRARRGGDHPLNGPRSSGKAGYSVFACQGV